MPIPENPLSSAFQKKKKIQATNVCPSFKRGAATYYCLIIRPFELALKEKFILEVQYERVKEGSLLLRIPAKKYESQPYLHICSAKLGFSALRRIREETALSKSYHIMQLCTLLILTDSKGDLKTNTQHPEIWRSGPDLP
jgi:hypothetical protein